MGESLSNIVSLEFDEKVTIGELAIEFYNLLIPSEIRINPPFSWIDNGRGWQLLLTTREEFHVYDELCSVGFQNGNSRLDPEVDTSEVSDTQFIIVDLAEHPRFQKSIDELLDIYPGKAVYD